MCRYKCIYMYICAYICVYASICICMYISAYINACMYTYTHTHTHTPLLRSTFLDNHHLQESSFFFFFFSRKVAFIKKIIYFCLHWVFIAVLGLLILVASPVAEHGFQGAGFGSCGSMLCCLSVCGNLPRQGITTLSPALIGGFLTTRKIQESDFQIEI